MDGAPRRCLESPSSAVRTSGFLSGARARVCAHCSHPRKEGVIINQSPHIETVGFSLNAKTAKLYPDVSFMAQSVLGYIMSPQVSNNIYYHPDSGARAEQRT